VTVHIDAEYKKNIIVTMKYKYLVWLSDCRYWCT